MAEDGKTAEQIAAEQAAADQKAAEEAAAAATGAKAGEGDQSEMLAELERTKNALKMATKEATQRRHRLDELEKAEAERKAAQMSETEKLQAELDEARAESLKAQENARTMLIKSAFIAEAAKAGAAFPEDVYALADKTDVDVNDAGAVTGVAEAVKALIAAGRLPLASGRSAPDLNGGAGGGERNASKPVTLTEEQLAYAKKMHIAPEKYAAQLKLLAEKRSA